MSPVANATSTTPSTTWLTWYRIENHASIAAIATPGEDATDQAHLGAVERGSTATDAKNAPARNWPSIAMLMTPDRSHRQPASAPRISGVACRIVSGSGLVIAAWKAPVWSA